MLFRGDWSRAQEIIKQKVSPICVLLINRRSSLEFSTVTDDIYEGNEQESAFCGLWKRQLGEIVPPRPMDRDHIKIWNSFCMIQEQVFGV